MARRNARKKVARGNRILKPGETPKSEVLSRKLPTMQRYFASLLMSSAKEFRDAHTDRNAHERLSSSVCRRLGLSAPKGVLRPLYEDKSAHFDVRAALVMEESRHAISEALFKRWSSKQSGQRGRGGDVMNLALQSMQTRKQAGHVVFVFASKKPFTPSENYNIRPGACFEILPPGPRSIDRILLGNVASNGGSDLYEESRDTLSLMVYSPFGSFPEQGEWQVAPVTSLISMVRQFEACTVYARRVPFVHNLMGKKNSTHIRFDQDDDCIVVDSSGAELTSVKIQETTEEKKEEDFESKEENPFFVLPTLNETQELACRNYHKAPSNSISLVQGPPGTGKTTLLITIMGRYLTESVSLGKKRRLLVCAPTNKAVSVLANRYLESVRESVPYMFNAVMVGDQDKLLDRDGSDDIAARRIFAYTWAEGILDDSRAIRQEMHGANPDRDDLLCRTDRLCTKLVKSLQKPPSSTGLLAVSSEVDRAVQAISTNGDTSRSSWKHLSDALEVLEAHVQNLDAELVAREVIRSADVIFCTLASSGSMIMKTTDCIEDLIVDEAAASTEPELYIPFHLMPKRLLAVGDPKQLPATVLSRKAERMGLSKSLHERLMYDLEKTHIMLDVQYRMKPAISSFPSRQFYDAKLSNGHNVTSASYQSSSSVLDGKPYTFLQVDGSEQQGFMGSFSNISEAQVVRDLVASLRQASTGDSPWYAIDKVRVITFYQAQVSTIQRLLRESGLGQVVVATVDSSQGCESDIIIVSFVRSNRAGFLDHQRLNVSLTRAKHQLVCVGNAKGLLEISGSETLQALARDAFDRNIVDEHTMTGKVGKRPSQKTHKQNPKKRSRKKK